MTRCKPIYRGTSFSITNREGPANYNVHTWPQISGVTWRNCTHPRLKTTEKTSKKSWRDIFQVWSFLRAETNARNIARERLQWTSFCFLQNALYSISQIQEITIEDGAELLRDAFRPFAAGAREWEGRIAHPRAGVRKTDHQQIIKFRH